MTMNKCFGNEVFKEIKARDEWGSFFSYSQYQRLKRASDPAVVIKMAEENGYKGLNGKMTATELVESLVKQGSEIAERKEIWMRALVPLLFFLDPISSIGWVFFDKMDRRSREQENRKSREKTSN